MAFKGNVFQVRNIPNFAGGMNTKMASDEILDNELADCENITIDEVSATSACGYVSWDNSVHVGPYWGIYQFVKSDGTQRLIRQRQGILEYDSDNAGTWVACTLPTTGSPATTVSLTQKLCTFVTLNNTVLWCNGTNSVMSSTDGITWTLRSSLPKGILLNNAKNRILFLEAGTSKIWWSDINDPLTVGVSAWQYINPNDGQNLVGGCISPDGSVLIFKTGSVYAIDDITLDTVGVNPIGSVGNIRVSNHHSICSTENSVIFMGVDGLYEYIGGTIRKISGRMNFGGRNAIYNYSIIVAAYYAGEYHLSMPDADVATNYNAQEYIVHKNIPRNDSEQPYVISRNRRYFGCYGVEDYLSGTSREVTLYAGDSRTVAVGSPAAIPGEFVWINVFRDSASVQGLNGSTQSCWFVTKFFTEDIPYYVKKYKKLFTELKVTQSSSFTIYYRFDPYGSWNAIQLTADTSEVDWTYDDGSSGEWSDGFGFSYEALTRTFSPIEMTEKPRGIQFKVYFDTINDITILSMAYTFMPKPKFK
jgi:hypothetical protein